MRVCFTDLPSTPHPDILQVNDYYPFGMSMTSSEGENAYKYNGKELYEDHGLDWYDYGARFYDAELGRWHVVDPMAEKYYGWSPYNYTYNNPIYYIDPDGKDGVGAINNKEKTITIKAVYYTQTIPTNNVSATAYTSDQIASMQKNINSTLNGLGFSVTEGQYEGYEVQFDLQFREGGQSYELAGKAATETFEGIPIGNTFQRGNDKTHPKLFTEREEGSVIKVWGGVTTPDHKSILMNERYDTERNQIHEVFHTLFFNNDGAKRGIGSYSREDLPNQNDINKLINNNALPKVEIENE